MNIRASLWPAYREYLRRSDLPILVGPWRGEVGFEALYWIPFIHRFVKSYGIDSKRIIPISRGGASAWYGSQHGVELYRMRTIQQVRVENKVQHVKHAQLKQTHWIEFDRAVVKDAAKALGLKKYLTLHPAWMYARLYPFFLGQRGMQDIDQDVYFDQLPAPALPDGLELPERFVAVRFYLRYTYNNHPMLIQFAQESIKAIARHTPVVLLNSGIHADDHMDIGMKLPPNVARLSDLTTLTPDVNLAVQSAVIAKSQGFVGTYGGLSQLALRLGKPSVSYYQDWGMTAMAHKHLADALALQQQIPCLVQKVGELPLIQSVVPQIQLG
jgi:hypothetical protein